MRYIYSGPSWAKSSFPTDHNSTNLARQWNLPYVDCSMLGASVTLNIKLIEKLIEKQDNNFPIIWVYNEPLADIEQACGMTVKELLTRDDWENIRNECNQFCLEQISKLGRPVLLIGGHSDITDCNFSNIHVACNSWQKFIAKRAGLLVNDTITGSYDSGTEFKIDRCWGAEVMHKQVYENPNITPVNTLIDSVWETFFFWKEIERLGWFYEVHPNKQATEAFADFLRPDIIKFLEDTK